MKRMATILLLFAYAFSTYAKEKSTSAGKSAKVYCKEDFVCFEVGVGAFPADDNTTIFFKVPDAYRGRKITLSEPGTTKPLSFKVKEAGTVTLVVSKLQANPLVSQGWVAMDTAYLGNENKKGLCLQIMEKILQEGEYSIKEKTGPWFAVRLLK